MLTPPTPDLKIMDSEWLIMNTRGFASEDEARQFGHRLKTAVEVSAVGARVGVDTGRNLATSGLGKTVKDALAQKGAHVRDNIHGLDVFPDHPNTGIFNMNATGIVHAAPDPFLSDLDEIVQAAMTPSKRVGDVILLLNYALNLWASDREARGSAFSKVRSLLLHSPTGLPPLRSARSLTTRGAQASG